MTVKRILVLALVGVLVAGLVMTMSCMPPEDDEPEASLIEVSALSYDPELEMGKIDFAISVDASSSYLVEVDATDFSQLNLAQDSFVGWTSIEGEPRIPVVRMSVAIPPGMDDDISIDIEEPILTGTIEDVLIVPVEKHEDPMEAPVYETDEEIYNSDEQYPATWTSRPEVEFFDGFEILTFEICPVRYRPIERDIDLYDIRGSITLHGDFPYGEPRESTPFEAILGDVILNGEEAMSWVRHQIEVDPLVVQEVASALSEQPQDSIYPWGGYTLIICADDFVSQAYDLATHKMSRDDYPIPTFVFSVGQIRNLIQTGDIPNRIREFIRAVYSIYGPPYIILLGDVYMMGGPYAAGKPEPPYTNYFELGSEARLQGFPQFVQSFTNARGIVSVGLAVTKVGNPDYAIKVGIRDALSTNAADLVSFEIQPYEVRTYDNVNWSEKAKIWIHKNLAEHVDLNPTQTYYLVVYTDTWDSENYYQLWCQQEYEPDSASSIFPFPIAWGTNPWIRVFDKEMIFSAQLYHSSSVPARYVEVQKRYNFYDEWAHPSDYYYACLDYGQDAWNADGDGRYCEYSADDSTTDFYPEGFIGRLPASNTAEATAMVNAIITYEQPGVTSGGDSLICCETFGETSSDLTTYASAGQNYVQVYDATQFDRGENVVVTDSDNWECATIESISGNTLFFFHNLANSYSPANGGEVRFQDDRPFSWKESDFYPVLAHLGGACTEAWDYGDQGYPWYYPRLDVFETVFNSGVEAVQLAGHGHGTTVTVGLVTDNMVQNDLQDTGAFPVVFGYACRSAYYDLGNSEDCLGEVFVVTGKASSYVGCSRIAWGLGPEDATGFVKLDKQFWNCYGASWVRRTGQALTSAKVLLLSTMGLDSLFARHHILAVQLLGDPETLHK